ncbi:hypothetical protein, partial [Mycobacterium colombiense]|uniref:hypothetical protein n=1 Tax=Mycobacterium colombiense TaxID=339268 RepID=UPI00197B945B
RSHRRRDATGCASARGVNCLSPATRELRINNKIGLPQFVKINYPGGPAGDNPAAAPNSEMRPESPGM